MKNHFIVFVLLFLSVTACDSSTEAPAETSSAPEPEVSAMPVRTVVIDSPDTIFSLFAELNYTQKEWTDGIRLVPRIYISGIPKRWKKTSQKLTVAKKKELFFRLLGPLVLHANDVIKQDRKRLLTLPEKFSLCSDSDKKWLLELAMDYNIIPTPDTDSAGDSKNEDKGSNDDIIDEVTELSDDDMAELKIRVDVIPVSLALAQGAEESGWATSRFAVMGNSLFGQWTFSGKGIKPKKKRKGRGNYGLARFDTPLDSVLGYMRNLNTHRAYKGLRKYRAELRKQEKEVTGYALATKLDKYSERRQKYVKGLHTIMRVNHLAATDQAQLSDKEIIYLVHK